MKKKNGFTLVELLVVIALMLSILGISVVSFITISDKKKEDAWENVKEEMVLAGEQFFNNNKYYLEGLSDNNSYARVSIGSLVEEDYLNVVTNPKTNKLISSCDYIEVKLNTNKYTYNYYENKNNDQCNVKNYVTASEPGAPEGNIKYYNESGNETLPDKNTDWFNINSLGENGKLKACIKVEKSNGAIISAKIKGINANKDENGEYCTTIDEDVDESYSFTLTNQANKTWTHSEDIKKDTETPTLEVNMNKCNTYDKDNNTLKNCEEGYSNNTWINKYVNTSLTTSDSVSGVDYSAYKTTGKTTNNNYNSTLNKNSRDIVAEGTSYITYKACDKAGNCIESDEKIIKLDRTTPIVSLNGYVGENKVIESIDNNNLDSTKLTKRTNQDIWINKNNALVLRVSDSDTLSGIEKTTCTDPRYNEGNDYYTFNNWRRVMKKSEGVFTFNCETTDNAGNEQTASYTVKRDVTPPEIKVVKQTEQGQDSNRCSGNKYVHAIFEVSDNYKVYNVYHFISSLENEDLDSPDPFKNTIYSIENGEIKQYDCMNAVNEGKPKEINANKKYQIERYWATGEPQGCKRASGNNIAPVSGKACTSVYAEDQAGNHTGLRFCNASYTNENNQCCVNNSCGDFVGIDGSICK